MKPLLPPILLAALSLAAVLSQPVIAQSDSRATSIERGRHLILIGHCNNCHTAGYAASGGKVPEERWLTGNPVGWRGKQGTTYAINLRLYVQGISEDGWVQAMRQIQSRAPMPWWTMRDHTEEELKTMYRYIRSLTPIGEPAPAFLPPDQEPRRPYNQLPDMS